MTNNKRQRAPRGMGSITQLPNGDYKGITTTGYAVTPHHQEDSKTHKDLYRKDKEGRKYKKTPLVYKYKVSTFSNQHNPHEALTGVFSIKETMHDNIWYFLLSDYYHATKILVTQGN